VPRAAILFGVAGFLVMIAYLDSPRRIFSHDGILVAAIVVPLGLLLCLLHRGVTISPDGTKLTSWWWLLFRLDHDTYSVAMASEVRIAPETGLRNGIGVRVVIGYESVLVGSVGEYAAARRRAELVARAIQRKIVDATTDPATVRPANRLDEAVRFRVAPSGEHRELPSAPRLCRISWSVDDGDGRAVFELPERGLQPRQKAFGFAVLALLALNVLDVYVRSGSAPVRRYVLWIGAVVAVVILVIWINASLSRETVTVAGGKLTVTKLGRTWASTRSIEVDEIEDLVVAEGGRDVPSKRPEDPVGPFLHARSDEKTLVFGADLDPWESAWLRDALEAVIASSDPS